MGFLRGVSGNFRGFRSSSGAFQVPAGIQGGFTGFRNVPADSRGFQEPYQEIQTVGRCFKEVSGEF